MKTFKKIINKFMERKIINIVDQDRPDDYRWTGSKFMAGDVVKEPVLGIFVIRENWSSHFLCDGEYKSEMLVKSFLTEATQNEIESSWIYKPRKSYAECVDKIFYRFPKK